MEPEVLSPFSGGFEIFGVLLVILAIVVLWSTVKIVPQGMNYTVENFGRYTRTLQPGLHILVPVMERVGHRMNMKEQVLDIPSQDVITRDNAMVRVNGVTFFQVINAARAAYEVDQLEPSIVNLFLIDFIFTNEEWAKLRRASAAELMNKKLDAVAKRLGDKPFLDGERFTVGDLMMATVLRFHPEVAQRDPRLAAYINRCMARPAFQRALNAQLGDYREAA